MLLSSLITSGKELKLSGQDCDITGIATDSRQIKPGYLFIAVPGTQQDGRAYIDDAIAKGAIAVLTPEDANPKSFKTGIAVVTAPDARHAASFVASRFYPQQPETVATVTGTSGKTSTVQFARQMWQENGHDAASIGTLGLITPREAIYGSLTTPDAITLHKALDNAARQGIARLAMEASSHGLDLRRLDHVRVKIGAFTNLSRDHLDYHDDMESYLEAKIRLFAQVMPEGQTAVLNADAPEYGRFETACRQRGHATLTYGKNGKDLRIKESRWTNEGQLVRFSALGRDYEATLPVAGDFQIWNCLCALGIVIASGDDAARAVAAIGKVTGVPGRLERIGVSPKGGTVFVDYAHKPGALENVLATVRNLVEATPRARLHVVFGCGGNRDKGKRPEMGRIAQRMADVVIVTDDNPRKEKPEDIRRDILTGCAPSPNLREIGGRTEAIQTAISGLEEGDVLVIAGKGHETGQIVGEKVLPFDDAEVAREALRGREQK